MKLENQVCSLELAKKLKISKMTANRKINQLVREGFLKKEVIGKSWRLFCNASHPYNKSRKISYNLSMIYESGLVDEIRKKFGGTKAIVLFGSYRKGDENEKSDVDIAVEVLDDIMEVSEFAIIKKYGLREKVIVNLHRFNRKKINANLFLNILNGIVLDGFLEARK